MNHYSKLSRRTVTLYDNCLHRNDSITTEFVKYNYVFIGKYKDFRLNT